jgi:hypothetical protein
VLLRQIHLYVGVAIAPSVLFFALTGMLQLFTLHEPHGDYRPIPVVEKLGMLHKDQIFALKPKSPRPPAGPARAARPQPGPKPAVLALKVFFLGVAVGLVISTALGLWMALSQPRRKGLVLAVLALGALAPLLLVLL